MAARPRKQFARDANILSELAAGVGGTIIQVLRTVIKELTHMALSRRRAEYVLPFVELQRQRACSSNPFRSKRAVHCISKRLCASPSPKGYLGDGKANHVFIPVENVGR